MDDAFEANEQCVILNTVPPRQLYMTKLSIYSEEFRMLVDRHNRRLETVNDIVTRWVSSVEEEDMRSDVWE